MKKTLLFAGEVGDFSFDDETVPIQKAVQDAGAQLVINETMLSAEGSAVDNVQQAIESSKPNAVILSIVGMPDVKLAPFIEAIKQQGLPFGLIGGSHFSAKIHKSYFTGEDAQRFVMTLLD